jgi:hypothetical protein
MMKRRRFLWWPMLLLAVLGAPFLAACGGSKGASPATAGSAPGPHVPPSSPPEASTPVSPGPAGPEDRRGYVVLVDGMRVIIDLANGEIKKDTLIAITRRQTLTHPVTGEHLGEIALEVGRARIVEVQPKFSVAELIGFKPGLTARPQDRVTVLPGTP